MIQERVVIVGGGLAGLAAAIELVDRGLDVTLIEAGDRCGGKLSAWRDEEGDPVEHGIHGWWPNYVNFIDLMDRVGVSEQALQAPLGSLAVLPDGSTFALKPLLIRLPSPLFLAAHFVRSPARGIIDLLSVVRAGLGILGFDARRDFTGLDRFTFRSWLWRLGVSRRMFELLFEPYIRSFAFDSATRISAAAALSSFQLYLVRRQTDLQGRWLTDDPDSLIIQPMVDYIQQRGGRVITGVRAEGLLIDSSGRVTAVQTSQPVDEVAPHEPVGVDALTRVEHQAIPEEGFMTISAEYGRKIHIGRDNGEIVAYGEPDGALPAGKAAPKSGSQRLRVDFTSGGAVMRSRVEKSVGEKIGRLALSRLPEQGFVSLSDDPPILVGRNADQRVVALSGRCTHMGCTVAWRDEADVLACPCHGAMFSPDGQVVAGPAQSPLPTYKTRVEGDEVFVLADTSAAPVLEADHFIVAVDVEACKTLLSDRLREFDAFRRIDFLDTTPVIVVRLWFPGTNLLGDKTSGVFVDYPLLDNFFVLSNLQKSFRDRDETVIEVQAYMVEDEIELADDRLLELVLADLRRAFPTLNMPPRKFYIQRHKSLFTHHTAGSDEHRPDTRTPLPNLYLGGDWVTRSPEVWNMERAVVTGKLAAAAVIEESGGVGPAVREVPLGGPLFRASVAVVRAVAGVSWWLGRQLRGDSPSAPPQESPPPDWGSTILFGVMKFRGEPNEQLVMGRFRSVAGRLNLMKSRGGFRVTGDFEIDLDSLESGIALRDYNVRTAVFNTPLESSARLRLLEARPVDSVLHALVFDKELLVECVGELTLNGVTQRLSFRARATLFQDGLLSARTEDDIVIRAGDFNLDLEALRAHCGAVVNDEVRLSFRVAVPYTVIQH